MFISALTVDENYTLKLYKNNVTLTQTNTLADFTIADFTGFSPITLTRAGFNAPALVGNKAQIAYSSAQTFTCTGGATQTCYGYIILGATSGKVLIAEAFLAAQSFSNGVTLTMTPTVTVFGEN